MTENVPAPEEVLAEAQTVMNDNPLGLEYGDIDGQSEAKNPLSSGELPSANLRLWRTMQRAIRELIDSFDTSKLNDVDTILLQTRILQSDSLLMTWFISSGNLQEMFELKMKSLLERGVCEDEDDMRLQICVDFINKIRQRNKEDQQYQNKYLPTIGIELEFLFIHDPDYPELNFNASDYYYRTNRLKPLDPPYKPIQEVNGAIEYAIGPSASHLTQLREILHLAKIGLHPSNFFSPHITIGGLDLSPDHQEPLYIQSLVFGCGFSEFKQADLNLRREKGKFKIKLRERYKKITETPDGIQYVPFLKKRSAEYTKPYGQKQTEQDEDSLRSVEFRLGNRFKSFQNLTREVDAIYYLSTAAIAHQKDASERDPVEVKLSQIWEELAHKLDEIYLQIGIHFPSGATKSFIFGSSDSEEVKAKRGSTPYNTHLFELGYQSATDAVFRSQIRTLVKNARKEILDCINCR